MTAEELKYREALKLLLKHVGKSYYRIGELHNSIVDAMNEHAESLARERAVEFDIYQAKKYDNYYSSDKDADVMMREKVQKDYDTFLADRNKP